MFNFEKDYNLSIFFKEYVYIQHREVDIYWILNIFNALKQFNKYRYSIDEIGK